MKSFLSIPFPQLYRALPRPMKPGSGFIEVRIQFRVCPLGQAIQGL